MEIIPTTNQPYYEHIKYYDMKLFFDDNNEPVPSDYIEPNLHIESMERAIVDEWNHYRLQFRGNIILSSDIAYLRLKDHGEICTVKGYIYNNIFRCKRSDIVWRRDKIHEPNKVYVQPGISTVQANILGEQLRGEVAGYAQTRAIGISNG